MIMFMLLGLVAMAVLFIVVEFHHIQRNHDSWEWCKQLYKRTNASRIKW